MMTDTEFELWCIKRGLDEHTITAIQNIRQGEPVRAVQSGHGHGTGLFSSKKMRLSLQYESLTLELVTLYTLDQNPQIIEIYDQPSVLQVSYVRPNGKRDSFPHYPDFFVIAEDWFGYIECKYNDKLRKINEKHPDRYTLNGDTWMFPACEKLVATFGFDYRIITETTLNMTLYSNIVYLSGYTKRDLDEEVRRSIQETVRQEPGITLLELTSRYNADDVHQLIVNGDVYVDLNTTLLEHSDFASIYPNRATADALQMIHESQSKPIFEISQIVLEVNAEVIWSSKTWKIANVGMDEITLLNPNSEDVVTLRKTQFDTLVRQGIIQGASTLDTSMQERTMELLRTASPTDLEKANQRAHAVERYMEGDLSVLDEVPSRTLRDWTRKYNIAKEKYGYGYLGLLNQSSRKGNRNRRLDPRVIKDMDEYIEKHFENTTGATPKSVYRQFKLECEKKALQPPTFKTFLSVIKKRSKYRQTVKRQGRRAGYQVKSPSLSPINVKQAQRPWERAHSDHKELGVVLRDSQTGLVLGKPWLTAIIDDYSRRILGSYITFESPGAFSVLSALRDCIRRFNRLPEQLVVDNGKEFHSVAFETLMAFFGKHKTNRPPAEPRYGNRIERYFGTIDTEFLKNLKGNTLAQEKPRQMTKSVNPRNHAVWTLRALHGRLDEFMYEIYDTMVHTSLGFSPREVYNSRMQVTGDRTDTLIPYTKVIDMLTLPPTPNDKLQVHRAGIKFQNRFYWSDAFSEPGILGTQVPVVYDPYNAGVLYAYCLGEWQECVCQQLEFWGRSLKEIEIVSAEYRKKYESGDKRDETKLAQFLLKVHSEEHQLQVAKDRAWKEYYGNPSDAPAVSLNPPIQPTRNKPIHEKSFIEPWEPGKKDKY